MDKTGKKLIKDMATFLNHLLLFVSGWYIGSRIDYILEPFRDPEIGKVEAFFLCFPTFLMVILLDLKDIYDFLSKKLRELKEDIF